MATAPSRASSLVSTPLVKHIVLAFDGSAEAARAAEFAAALAKSVGARATVLRFRETGWTRFGAPADMEPAEQLADLVRDAARRFEDEGVEVTAEIDDSGPFVDAGEIAAAADRLGADLIVVGSRGLSTGRAMIEGSVSHDLIHVTKTPAVIVPS